MKSCYVLLAIVAAFVFVLLWVTRRPKTSAEDYVAADHAVERLKKDLDVGTNIEEVSDDDFQKLKVFIAGIPEMIRQGVDDSIKSEGFSPDINQTHDRDDEWRYYYYTYAWPATAYPPQIYDKMAQFKPTAYDHPGNSWFFVPGLYSMVNGNERWIAYKGAHYYVQ